MSAAEIIQKAIEKLERLREVVGADVTAYVRDADYHVEGTNGHIALLGRETWPSVPEAAELIVTLHRTIDAQLAILRHVLDNAPMYTETELVATYIEEIALAKAILGGDA